MLIRLFVLGLALSAPGAALAEPQTGKAPDVLSGDPNEKICETVSVIGSRLSKKRICGTRAELAARRQQDRSDAERFQSSLTGSSCVAIPTNGKTTC